MCVLLIGGDKVNAIKEELTSRGVKEIIHWNCRKRSEACKPVPKRVGCIVMLTSFLKHSTMKKMKVEAKRYGIPALYAKRSRIDIANLIECSNCVLSSSDCLKEKSRIYN